ncbi:XK-related protein 4-like [Limulus polyphemus]|uniref:XK-related protein n=1 Tax=Limulus polyphemus TaxID=6850 RepID=A0ABM1B6A9_LIMPO|nr:XK-related protein 4-like [Limulus polyphemus]
MVNLSTKLHNGLPQEQEFQFTEIAIKVLLLTTALDRHPMVSVNELEMKGPTHWDDIHNAHLRYNRKLHCLRGHGYQAGMAHEQREHPTHIPEGRQIETILQDHHYPCHGYPLQQTEFIFTKQVDHTGDFTIVSAVFALVGIFSYTFNIGTDIAVCYFLHLEGYTWWFGLTVAFTAIPALTVNVFSLRWYMHKQEVKKNHSTIVHRPKMSKLDWTIRILFHVLLLGPVIRYTDLIIFGLRSRRERQQKQRRAREWDLTFRRTTETAIDDSVDYHQLTIQEDKDTALLTLLESLMESAPQLVLQIYILADRQMIPYDFWTVGIQLASIVASLFELSWSLASYHRALRQSVENKRNMTWSGMSVQFLWRYCTTAARVLSLALFASEYGYWMFPVCIGHWGIMTVWVMHQQTSFCDSETGEKRQCEEYLFNMAIGAVYLFCFLNVKDEPTRLKYLAYYIIVFIENSLMIILWYLRTDPSVWYHLPALICVFLSFSLGITFMLLFYRFCHPETNIPYRNRPATCC